MTSRTIEQRVLIAASPQTVWSFWTDPSRMCEWWGSAADLDARPGGRFRIDFVPGGETMLGEYLELEPHTRLVFSFGWAHSAPGVPMAPGSTTVEVTLTLVGEDTELVLVHRDFRPRRSRATRTVGSTSCNGSPTSLAGADDGKRSRRRPSRCGCTQDLCEEMSICSVADRRGSDTETMEAMKMRYLLMICNEENVVLNQGPVAEAAMLAEYGTFSEEMATRGVLRDGARLRPTSDATTVRVQDGEILTADGPFAETKEQIGGYYIVDCANLDEAIAVAAKIPHARVGAIEVRPIWEM